MNSCSKTELFAKVSAHARLFELAPLARLLRKHFPEHVIRYQGRDSLACEPSLIESVELEERRIVVYLNLGLLSSTSPLASYFLRLRHDTRAGTALEELLHLCDDALLRARADASHVIETTRLTAGNRQAPHQVLRETIWQLQQPRSPASLHWLFKRICPELEVSVRRIPREYRTPAASARNGWATLGGTALDAALSVTVPSYEVTLAADDAEGPHGDPWQQEIMTRLGELSSSRAAITGVELRVILIERASAQRLILQGTGLGFAALGQPSSPQRTWL